MIPTREECEECEVHLLRENLGIVAGKDVDCALAPVGDLHRHLEDHAPRCSLGFLHVIAPAQADAVGEEAAQQAGQCGALHHKPHRLGPFLHFDVLRTFSRQKQKFLDAADRQTDREKPPLRGGRTKRLEKVNGSAGIIRKEPPSQSIISSKTPIYHFADPLSYSAYPPPHIPRR